MKNKISKVNILKYVAFGGLAIYLWYRNKKQGKALGIENPNNLSFHIDTDKAINAASDFLPLTDNKKQIINLATKEFLNGYKKRVASGK